MSEMIKMVVVLTLLSALSGGLLATLRDKTKDQIINQELQNVKGPAVRALLEGCSNDPIAERFKVTVGEEEKDVFVGTFDGTPNTIVIETSGSGYGGSVGLMVGINVNEDKLVGVGVTTHSETPGLGANAKDDPSFAAQFKGLSLENPFKVLQDGGAINAVSGATSTSRAVCNAANKATDIYKELKPKLVEQLKSFSK